MTDSEGVCDPDAETVTVFDTDGAIDAVLFAEPTLGEAPLEVIFDGSQRAFSSGSQDFLVWTLDFGDGTSTGGRASSRLHRPNLWRARHLHSDADLHREDPCGDGCDPEGDTDSVTITVEPEPNQAPDAVDGTLTTAFETPARSTYWPTTPIPTATAFGGAWGSSRRPRKRLRAGQ